MFYVANFGLRPLTIGLMLFYMAATSMSITVGYHRLFSHVTYKAHPVLQFLVLFFGAAAYEQSALRWSSQHRTHHLYVDTDKDPYSIKKGFFYAHIGWLLFWKHPDYYENAVDLQRNRLVMHQHQYYPLWAAVSGIILPMLIGFCYGDPLGAFVFAVCARMVYVHQTTFCINSVCHTFGQATYDIYSTAKDHWLVAFITNGEGYHNFHHHFPSDYRNGVRWYQWDPSKWMIAVLARVGLAWDLKRVSTFRILAARLSAEKQRAEDRLKECDVPNLPMIQMDLKSQYERLMETLSDWESSAREYQAVLRERLNRGREALAVKAAGVGAVFPLNGPAEKKRLAALKKAEAEQRFQQSLQQWQSIYLHLKAA